MAKHHCAESYLAFHSCLLACSCTLIAGALSAQGCRSGWAAVQPPRRRCRGALSPGVRPDGFPKLVNARCIGVPRGAGTTDQRGLSRVPWGSQRRGLITCSTCGPTPDRRRSQSRAARMALADDAMSPAAAASRAMRSWAANSALSRSRWKAWAPAVVRRDGETSPLAGNVTVMG